LARALIQWYNGTVTAVVVQRYSGTVPEHGGQAVLVAAVHHLDYLRRGVALQEQ
jgi:hypothetical protein